MKGERMLDKLKIIWGDISQFAAKAYNWSPFCLGLILGFYGKPIIQGAVAGASALVHLLIKL
jgi:hypothetical protein